MNYVSIVLDESGSMAGQCTRVVGGINEYINKLKADIGGDCHVTLNLFDSEHWREHFSGPLADFKPMVEADYRPGAMTPLYDAVGRSIKALEAKATPADKCIVVVDTDGQENHSKEQTQASIKAKVKEMESKGWAFVFMATGLDVQSAQHVGAQAASMNFTAANTRSFDHGSRQHAYANLATASVSLFAGTTSAANIYGDQPAWNPSHGIQAKDDKSEPFFKAG